MSVGLGEGWISRAGSIFRAIKMYDTIKWTHVITHFSKPRGPTMPTEPYNDCELWVSMMCLQRFIRCKECTTPTGDADNGGRNVCVDSAIFQKSVPSPQFCCEPKSALKTINFKNFLKKKSTVVINLLPAWCWRHIFQSELNQWPIRTWPL